MRALGLILVLVAAPSAATTAEQFDLVCQTKFKPRVFAKAELGERRYRIDLGAKRWCYGDCSNTADLVEIENTRLTFASTSSDTLRNESSEQHWVDRQTGELRQSSYSRNALGTRLEQTEGKCERAPFSGFPATPTQF